MNQRVSQCSIKYHVFLQLIYLQILPYSFSRSTITSSDLMTLLHPIYSPNYKINISSLYVLKSPKFSFYYMCYINSLMSSFLILSHLVLRHIQRNILVSATMTLCSCQFFTIQHSVSYNFAVLALFDKKIPSTKVVFSHHIKHLRHSSISSNQL